MINRLRHWFWRRRYRAWIIKHSPFMSLDIWPMILEHEQTIEEICAVPARFVNQSNNETATSVRLRA